MPRAKLRVRSALTLETRAGPLAGKRWMGLLAHIGSIHSIAAAARAAGLSYKAAWDAVEAMNNFSDRPLVRRFKGGKGGGGTNLTARGRQLVQTYRAVEAENSRFLSLLNSRIRNLDQDLRIIGRLAMLTSARNHFAGIVTRIRRGSVNDEVQLLLSGGETLTAIVTHASAQNLGLKAGVEAIALVKASWVIVAPASGSRLKLSARNQLAGTVRRMLPGAVNTEVVIALKGGNSVAAIITNDAARQLKLVAGKRARAIFKASSVILGVAS
jgi:molybdate transport system regulatory protein